MTYPNARWPSGDGEMAARIRAHDWGATPLGSVEVWPQSLRTAVDMVLAMPGPATILWGPAHAQIYNDAYIVIARDRHPALLGMPVVEGWPEVYEEVIAPLLAEASAGRATQLTGYAVPLRTPHGELKDRCFDTAWSPVRGETGAVMGVLQTLAEVTDSRQAQAALRASEQRFRSLVAAGSYAIYRMSAGWEQMYQLDGRSFLADTGSPSEGWVDTYILPEDRPTVFTTIERAIREKGLFELEHRVRRSDGSVGWTLSRAVPIFGDEGEIVEWFGAASDVTARKATEAALRESEERHAFLLKLSDALRSLADPADIAEVASCRLGERLGVNRVCYSELKGEHLHIRREYVRGVPATVGEYSVAMFGQEFLSAYQSSELVTSGDVERDGRLTPAGRAALRDRSIAAFADMVLLDGEHGTGVLAVQSATPRDWTEAEMRLIREVGERVRAATARARAEIALCDSEERFAQFAASSSGALWIRDAGTLAMEYTSPAIEPIYGIGPDGILGDMQKWVGLVVPEDRDTAIAHIAQAQAGAAVTHEFRIRRLSDGDERWIRNTDFPLYDAGGRVQRVGGIAEDVTELREIEAALVTAEARQRALIEGVPHLVWRAVDGGAWTWASPQWTAYTGQAVADTLGYGWLEPVHPDDRDAAMALWHSAQEVGHFAAEYRLRNASDDRYRWFQTRAMPVRDADGTIIEWLGTSTDVDDLRQLQDQQSVMVAELQHRTRNLLGVVRSIAAQTMAQAGSTEAFREQFNDRLSALSRVQGLLSRSEQEPITLGVLIQTELDALGAASRGERIRLAGPEVGLRKATVQTFALALHELATNALKYGALTSEDGRLSVTWTTHAADGEGQRLVLEWVEEGLVPSREEPGPAPRGGYGRELIERALPYVLKARTRYELNQTDLRCIIDLPLTETVGAGNSR